jgi:hypothetical protein
MFSRSHSPPPSTTGQYVISIPEAVPLAGFQAPLRPRGQTLRTAGASELQEFGAAIDSTSGTDSAVALENPISQITGVSPQLPLVHAPGGAERNSTFGHFEIAPAAEAPAIWPHRQRTAIHPAARRGARGAHHKHLGAILFGVVSRLVGSAIWHANRIGIRDPVGGHAWLSSSPFAVHVIGGCGPFRAYGEVRAHLATGEFAQQRQPHGTRWPGGCRRLAFGSPASVHLVRGWHRFVHMGRCPHPARPESGAAAPAAQRSRSRWAVTLGSQVHPHFAALRLRRQRFSEVAENDGIALVRLPGPLPSRRAVRDARDASGAKHLFPAFSRRHEVSPLLVIVLKRCRFQSGRARACEISIAVCCQQYFHVVRILGDRNVRIEGGGPEH